MESETDKYELGYLLKGDLGEEKALEENERLRKLIEDEQGIIIQEIRPKKQNLAYPIKKYDAAYFGSLKFIFPIEKIEALKKSLEKIEPLRLLLARTKTERETAKHSLKRRIARHPSAPASVTDKEFPQKQEGMEQKESLQVEEIDKKLEEILGQ